MLSCTARPVLWFEDGTGSSRDPGTQHLNHQVCSTSDIHEIVSYLLFMPQLLIYALIISTSCNLAGLVKMATNALLPDTYLLSVKSESLPPRMVLKSDEMQRTIQWEV